MALIYRRCTHRAVPNTLAVTYRNYMNYKTHGEMAKLKRVSRPEVFYDEPKWPKVKDNSWTARFRNMRQRHYDAVKVLPTAGHKMFIINAMRGRETALRPDRLGYMSLKSYQYLTRTFHRQNEEMFQADPEEPVDPSIAALVEEIIMAQNAVSSGLSEVERGKRLFRAIMYALRHQVCDQDCAWIEDARIEAFWRIHHVQRHSVDEHQGKHHTPYLQISKRADFMMSSPRFLETVIDPNSPEVFQEDFPIFDYTPLEFGWTTTDRQYLISCPGLFCEAQFFPVVTTSSYDEVLPKTLDPSVITDRILESQEARENRLGANALIYNFGATVGAAYNRGFTLFHEITSPFVSQHVTSNGRDWHFSKFQLNTLAFGPDFERNKQNFAWSSGEMKLFDCIEDGKVKGFNPEVISSILKVLQAPQIAEHDAPFLNSNVSDEFLGRGTKLWKEMAARKLDIMDHIEREIPTWVKIYKMHEDAPIAPNLRWERHGQQHMYQYDKVLYDRSVKEKYMIRKRKLYEKFYQGTEIEYEI